MRTGAIALLVCLLPAALAPQVRADSATLTGEVKSVLNGELLAGVLVALPGLQKFVVTDSTGVFAFTVPPGTHHMRVRYQEHVNEDYDMIMRAGQHTRLEILLDVAAVHLAPVVVVGRPSTGDFGIAGFYERKRFGFGRFVTAEQLSQDRSQSLADYLSRFVIILEPQCPSPQQAAIPGPPASTAGCSPCVCSSHARWRRRR